MVCKVCGIENAEDAVFCKHCGKRLDGIQVCKNCGTENEEDAMFCKKCGTTLAATTTPQAHRTAAQNGEIALETLSDTPIWKKIVAIFGWSFAMLGLFFSLLFTFFIGTGMKASVADFDLTDIVGSVGLNLNHNLYYYFGDVYSEIRDQQLSYPMTDAQLAAVYIPTVIGTVVAAGVILGVCVLSGLAIYKFVAYLRGKSDKNFTKPTVAAYAVFILGSLALLSLDYVSATVKSSGITVRVGSILNSLTIAGVAVGGVCLFLFITCKVALKGKALLQNQNLIRLILSTVGIVFITIMLIFLPHAAVGLSESDTSMRVSATFPFMIWMRAVVLDSLTLVGEEMVVAILAQFVQIALIALTAVAFIYQLSNVCEEKKSNLLGLSIPMLVLSIAYLVLSIVYANMVRSAADMTGDIIFTSPIVVLVFSVLHFALSIVQRMFSKKQQPTLEIAE